MKSVKLEQLLHFRFGPIWDGNLISKSARDSLVDDGLLTRTKGFQFLTEKGVATLVELGLLHEDTWRGDQKGTVDMSREKQTSTEAGE